MSQTSEVSLNIYIYRGIQENIYKKSLLQRDGKEETLQERNFEIKSRHKYNEQYKYNPSYKKLMAKCKKETETFFYKIPM